VEVTIGHAGAQLIEDAQSELAEIDLAEGHLLRAEARQREQPLDQIAHASGAGANNADNPAALRIQAVGVLVLQDPRKGVDGPERHAQIVQHGTSARSVR
jgi:hypothetical protein